MEGLEHLSIDDIRKFLLKPTNLPRLKTLELELTWLHDVLEDFPEMQEADYRDDPSALEWLRACREQISAHDPEMSKEEQIVFAFGFVKDSVASLREVCKGRGIKLVVTGMKDPMPMIDYGPYPYVSRSCILESELILLNRRTR